MIIRELDGVFLHTVSELSRARMVSPANETELDRVLRKSSSVKGITTNAFDNMFVRKRR